MSPSSINAYVGDIVSFDIRVNSGSQRVAAFGMNITYDANILSAVAVLAGADGFVSATNIGTPGSIITSGIDVSGTGPGSDLHLP